MMNEFWNASVVTRARMESLDDGGDHQRLAVTGYSGERFSDVIRYQPHGFSSHPPDGSVGHFLRVGESDRLFALGFETARRPRGLPPGVTALYNADGTVLKLLSTKSDFDHGGKNHHDRNVKKIRAEPSDWHQIEAPAVYLGTPPYYPVVTTAGPSKHVFAGIDPPAPSTPAGSIDT